ncbi:MAG: LytTR family transcriptional regulator DNA-binding domain-containing protein [Lachnospiraceae bacterium]|nr:LytTR family transcriptional regulator DNA-binding domain-containing protein [Lachnospiraceae bacterium]
MNLISELKPELTEIEVYLKYPSETREVRTIRSWLLGFDQGVVGRNDAGTRIIPVHSILYIEAVNRKVFIYTEHNIYETDKRLYEMAEILRGMTFIQASKQIIVNLLKVSSIQPEIGSRLLLTLDNGERIIASRQYAPGIKRELGIS